MKSLARWRIPLVLLLALSACVKTVVGSPGTELEFAL